LKAGELIKTLEEQLKQGSPKVLIFGFLRKVLKLDTYEEADMYPLYDETRLEIHKYYKSIME